MNSTNSTATKEEIERLRGLLRELKSGVKPGDRFIANQRVTLKRSGKFGEWVTHHQNVDSGVEYWGRYFTASDATGGESGAYIRALKDYLNRCVELEVNPMLEGSAVVTRGQTRVAAEVMQPVWDAVLQGILHGHIKDHEAAQFRQAMVRSNGGRRANGGAK